MIHKIDLETTTQTNKNNDDERDFWGFYTARLRSLRNCERQSLLLNEIIRVLIEEDTMKLMLKKSIIFFLEEK